MQVGIFGIFVVLAMIISAPICADYYVKHSHTYQIGYDDFPNSTLRDKLNSDIKHETVGIWDERYQYVSGYDSAEYDYQHSDARESLSKRLGNYRGW